MILGHDAIHAQLTSAIEQGKLHHAYLFDGPKGVGKASFAEAFLPTLLGDTGAADLLNSGAHPDFMRLEIEADQKTGKMRRDITRDQVEKLLQFLTRHSSLANRKVVLIDAADDLNVNAANNLLKWLEEPRPNTCILLMAHRFDRLLPTVRSRCARLRFRALDRAAFDAFVRQKNLTDARALFDLSGGIPGQALQLADPKVMAARETFYELTQKLFDIAPMRLASMSKTMMISHDFGGLEMSLRLLRHSLRSLADEGTNPGQADFAAKAYAKTLNKEAQAKSLNIDPAQVLAMVLLDLRDLARQGQGYVPRT